MSLCLHLWDTVSFLPSSNEESVLPSGALSILFACRVVSYLLDAGTGWGERIHMGRSQRKNDEGLVLRGLSVQRLQQLPSVLNWRHWLPVEFTFCFIP